jgi:hypothetical protein
LSLTWRWRYLLQLNESAVLNNLALLGDIHTCIHADINPQFYVMDTGTRRDKDQSGDFLPFLHGISFTDMP